MGKGISVQFLLYLESKGYPSLLCDETDALADQSYVLAAAF